MRETKVNAVITSPSCMEWVHGRERSLRQSLECLQYNQVCMTRAYESLGMIPLQVLLNRHLGIGQKIDSHG